MDSMVMAWFGIPYGYVIEKYYHTIIFFALIHVHCIIYKTYGTRKSHPKQPATYTAQPCPKTPFALYFAARSPAATPCFRGRRFAMLLMRR